MIALACNTWPQTVDDLGGGILVTFIVLVFMWGFYKLMTYK